MAWPHLPGVLKVVVTFGFEGKPSVNVHFIKLDSPTTPISLSRLLEMASIFKNALDVEWKPFMGSEWTVDKITATDWSLENGQQFEQVTGLPITGVAATEEVPASVAVVASHRTVHTGRSFRGRTYMMGLVEGNVGGNNVDGLLMTGIADYFTALDTAFIATGAKLAVYSLYSDGVPRVTPVATPVTSLIINSRVDTQRKRLP